MNSKNESENKAEVEIVETDDEIEVKLASKGNKNKNEDFDYEKTAKAAHEKNGKPFMSEVLPKLPKLRNGMRLLGVNEHSPLLSTGELYKMRIFRPDRPLSTSEIFEDGSRVRFTNLSRLVNDDFVITRFKFEATSFKTGLADSDSVGLKTIEGIFEAEDACNLTMRPFIEKKIKGKSYNHKIL